MQKQEKFLLEGHRSKKDVLFWVQNIKVLFGIGHSTTYTSNLVYMVQGFQIFRLGLDNPPQVKIWADLGTWDLTWSGCTPPPWPEMKIWADFCTWHLIGLDAPPPTSTENENLIRSWQLGFDLVWSTPSPTRK